MKKILLSKCFALFASNSNKKNTSRFNGILALFIMGMGMGVSWGQATLPFSYDLGKPTAVSGLTHTGLGTDYGASPKMKFDTTADNLILNFSSAPGTLSFKIQWNQSTTATRFPGDFTLQESADGITYSTVQLYNSTTGNALANSVIITETFSTLLATTRFLKWIYTTKTNGNIAIGAIAITAAATTPTLAVTGTTAHDSACSGTAATTKTYTITNTGTAASNVVVSSSDAQFVVSNLSSTSIGATNGTATYDVTFTPSSSGAKTATITVYYDTSTSATTSSLTGTGTTPVTQAVTSSAASSITAKSATLNGYYTTLGVCPATTEKGFVYSLTSDNNDPLVSGTGVTKTTVNLGSTGAYTLALTNLPSSSGYSFKAYVYNGTTYTYGTVQTFTTSSALAISGTISNGTVCPNVAASPITYTVTNNGATSVSGISVASSDAQFVVSSMSSSTIAAAGTATYTVTFTPTTAGAKSSTVTVSGTAVTSVTNTPTGTGTTPVTQAVTSSTPTPISYTTATLNGTVNALGVCPSSTQKGFVYSLTSANSDPVNAGSGVTTTSVTSLVTGAYFLALTGLTAGSSYTFKAYIYNGTTYTYGASTTFSTLTLTAPGAPTIGVVTAGNGTASILFTVPASNGGSSITGYTVTSNPGGLTGTGTTSPISVSGLTNGQLYTFTITATNAIGTSSLSSISNSVTPSIYCVPSGSSASGTYISNFTTTSGITNISNSTSGYSTSGYGDFTSLSVSQIANSSINYSLTLAGGTAGIAIWVDWNYNGLFTDSGENVYNSNAYMANGTYTGSITVPIGQSIGTYRLRVIVNFNGATPTSCIAASLAKGEAEDYTFTVVAPTNNWTGGTSTWNTAGNWSLGAVPLSTDNITISSGSPVLDVDYILSSGRTLIISGTGGLTINSGKTLTIAGTADFGSKAVTIKSDSNGTGAIGQVTGTLTGASNVTVESYIPAKRAWRALTAPVIGSTNNSIFYNWQNGGTPSFGAGTGVELWSTSTTSNNGMGIGISNSILQYNNTGTTGAWNAVTNTNTTYLFDANINNAFMVFVTGPYATSSTNISSGFVATTLRATGQLITGTKTYATLPSGVHTLIGNPYACPISPLLLLNGNTSFGANLWVWDANTTVNNGVGAYNTYDKTANKYTNITNSAQLATTPDIQSGQAFFVKASTGTATLSISESYKSTGTSTYSFLRTSSPPELLRVGLYKQVNNEWSGRDGAMTVILADADANQASNKMANGSENVAFTKNGASFASNHHLPLVASDVLNVKVWNTTAGANYKLKINTEEFSATNLDATLEDLYTNARTPLTLDGSAVEYPFTVTTEALSTGDRFRIVFQPSLLGNNIPKSNGFSIVPNPVTGDSFQVNLGSLATGTYSYSICNTIGQEVEKGSINNATQNTNYEVKMNNSATGIYIMKIKGNDNSVFTAKIIKK